MTSGFLIRPVCHHAQANKTKFSIQESVVLFSMIPLADILEITIVHLPPPGLLKTYNLIMLPQNAWTKACIK